MKKLSVLSCLFAIAMMMLLPVAPQVNAATVTHATWTQGPPPPPPPGGGH